MADGVFSGREFVSIQREDIPLQARGEWNRTQIMENRLGLSPFLKRRFFEERGKERLERIYQGRPVIHRDTRINGGVYLGAQPREAIVVDDSPAKDLILRNFYKGFRLFSARSALRESRQKDLPVEPLLVQKVFETVAENMRYNRKAVENIARVYHLGPDEKIYLGVYLREGVGVCRHQGLLAGYLLEKLVGEGYLKGKVSIDRNTIPGKGGHVWARYTTPDGQAYIIDAAQGFVGKLEEAVGDDLRWFYERPEDVRQTFLTSGQQVRGQAR